MFNLSAVQGVKQLQQTLQQELPPFSIENGYLHTEQSSVFLLEHDEIGTILIDPANSYSDKQLSDLGNGIALTYDKALMINHGQFQAIPYTLLGIDELTKEELNNRIKDLKGFLPILLTIVTIFIYLGLLAIVFLGITILGYLGILLRGHHKSIQYRHLWVMTAHSLTLPVIVLYWIDALITRVPITIFVLATYAILFLAIRTIPIPKKRTSA